LNSDDSSDAEDVVRVRPPRHISGGPIQAQKNLPVSIRAREVPHQLARDIAGIQVRKYQHVRIADNLGCGRLAVCNLRHQRRVDLQFAVEICLDLPPARVLFGQRCRRLDSPDGRMARTPFIENESNATRGFTPSRCRASCAVDTAISASCSTVGSGMTPQSAMSSTPFSP